MSNSTVVLDNGTGFVKCGYSGASFPSNVIATQIGRPVLRIKSKKANKNLKDIMIGDETEGVSHLLELSKPVENGVIQNMEEMVKIWDYTFSSKMRIETENKSILISEAPFCSKKQKEKIYEIMFEHFKFDKVQFTPQGVLSLYSAGLETGIVIDSGEGCTHCTPVFESYGIKKAMRQVQLGGRDLTAHLLRLLQRRGYHLNPLADFDTVRLIKEKCCYTAVNLQQEKRLANETTALEKPFTLPDGSNCTIGAERFETSEALFQPTLIDKECDGLSTQIWNSIQASDIDIRSQLYQPHCTFWRFHYVSRITYKSGE